MHIRLTLDGQVRQYCRGCGAHHAWSACHSALGRKPRSAAEIAAAELDEFQAAMDADAFDLDPNAPAAMKASPSGSEGDALHGR
jgi:hypothetical protein